MQCTRKKSQNYKFTFPTRKPILTVKQFKWHFGFLGYSKINPYVFLIKNANTQKIKFFEQSILLDQKFE